MPSDQPAPESAMLFLLALLACDDSTDGASTDGGARDSSAVAGDWQEVDCVRDTNGASDAWVAQVGDGFPPPATIWTGTDGGSWSAPTTMRYQDGAFYIRGAGSECIAYIQ